MNSVSVCRTVRQQLDSSYGNVAVFESPVEAAKPRARLSHLSTFHANRTVSLSVFVFDARSNLKQPQASGSQVDSGGKQNEMSHDNLSAKCANDSLQGRQKR